MSAARCALRDAPIDLIRKSFERFVVAPAEVAEDAPTGAHGDAPLD